MMTGNDSIGAVETESTNIYAEPEWLAQRLGDPDVRIVEVDVSRAAYDQWHIPGAVLWNAYNDLYHSDYSPLERDEFEELLRKSGLAPNTTIVFYGYGPTLGFWLVKAYGHEHALLLSGTRDGWREASLPWTTDVPQITPSSYTLPVRQSTQLMLLETLQSSLGSEEQLVLDVRSKAEFVGERFWPSGAAAGAGRSGHIPGAVHLPIEELHTADGALKSQAELRAIFEDNGVVPERSVVTYCTIGIRASEAALVLKYLLGYPNVRVYGGSWAEWGTRAETPVTV